MSNKYPMKLGINSTLIYHINYTKNMVNQKKNMFTHKNMQNPQIPNKSHKNIENTNPFVPK